MPKILLVEDTMTQALYMQHVLEKAGFQVIVARSGAKALEAYTDDLEYVLSDINMPGMNGYELVEKLKEKRDLPCILLVTASSVEEIAQISASKADAIAFKSGSERFVEQVQDAIASLATSDRNARFFGQTYRHLIAQGTSSSLP